MTRRRARTVAEKADACRMPVEQWQRARGQSRNAKSRGRRAAGTQADVSNWGECEGQLGMFGEEEA